MARNEEVRATRVNSAGGARKWLRYGQSPMVPSDIGARVNWDLWCDRRTVCDQRKEIVWTRSGSDAGKVIEQHGEGLSRVCWVSQSGCP